MLPKEITCDHSVGTILSNETINIIITYKSLDNNLGVREGEIFVKISTSELTVQNIKIRYKCELINNDILLNNKHIIFPTLPDGEKMNTTIIIKNLSNKKYICEWMTPPFLLSGLTIMPKVFEIPVNGFMTCFVEYESSFRPYGPFSHEKIMEEINASREKGLIDYSTQLEKDSINEYKTKRNFRKKLSY